MAERVFISPNGRIRWTFRTIGTVLPGFYEWGGEAVRERRRRGLFGTTTWERAGTAPGFTLVLFRGSNTVDPTLAGVVQENSSGYRKLCTFTINAVTQNGADTITNVRIDFSANNGPETLFHAPQG
jgi:hypothetical protein